MKRVARRARTSPPRSGAANPRELAQRIHRLEQDLGAAEGRFLAVPMYAGERPTAELGEQLQKAWSLGELDTLVFVQKHVPRGKRAFGRFEDLGDGWKFHAGVAA